MSDGWKMQLRDGNGEWIDLGTTTFSPVILDPDDKRQTMDVPYTRPRRVLTFDQPWSVTITLRSKPNPPAEVCERWWARRRRR